MKRVILALAMLVCLSWNVWAQSTYQEDDLLTVDGPDIPTSCSSNFHKDNKSAQTGTSGVWLEYIVETTIDLDVCLYDVRADAYVEGADGTSGTTTGILTASLDEQVMVPSPGTWTTHGQHYYGTTLYTIVLGIPNVWFDGGASLSEVTLTPQDEGDNCDWGTECYCESNEGEWDDSDGKCAWENCPIVINLDETGTYHMTSPAEGVRFDLDADKALEQLAWTPGDSNQAFLALDRNGNGKIDDGSELFGNKTPVPGGSAPNGFEALKFYLGGLDDQMDARSPHWSQLLLWVDRNHDGISQPDELTRVVDSGIVSINLSYHTENRRDAFGNAYRQRATVLWTDGHTKPIYDVWLAQTK